MLQSLVKLAAVCIFILFIRSIYRLFLHPLCSIPGPILPRVTSLWLYYHAYIGDEARTIHKLHVKYGSVVRVSPHEIDISDPEAIQPIYVLKGGFLKAECYANFDIEGHKTLFSTTETEYRAPRAKAVMPLFSTKALRDNADALYSCVDRFVERLWDQKRSGEAVNLLVLTRSLAIDVVSTHLFQRNYDAVSEKQEHLSVGAFVDAFVGVGKFFYLPNFVFVLLERGIELCLMDAQTSASMKTVDTFVEEVVSKTTAADLTYPGRLMSVGLSGPEIKAQCKDLIFAGTDSTGMNLATIIKYLVTEEKTYHTLKAELSANTALSHAAADIQSLPYLTGVIKEGLRLSMANPTRLPRVVPSSGWTFKGTYFPPGTIVGCSAYELHYNDTAFPYPELFRPERWIEGKADARVWFAFGTGSRACIARNLATVELYFATERLVISGVLEGARSEGQVDILEWFNSRVVGERIELAWSEMGKQGLS